MMPIRFRINGRLAVQELPDTYQVSTRLRPDREKGLPRPRCIRCGREVRADGSCRMGHRDPGGAIDPQMEM